MDNDNNTALAVHSPDVQLNADGGQMLSRMYGVFSAMERSSVLPSSIKNAADAAVLAAYGYSIGLDPIQAIYKLHMIEGRPSLSADAMAGLVMASPACEYLTPTHSDTERAEYTTRRVGAPAPVTMGFTREEARAAGLDGRGNWSKYPAAMLRARALTAICRAVYPDVCGGLYDPDELAQLREHAPSARVVTNHAVEQRASEANDAGWYEGPPSRDPGLAVARAELEAEYATTTAEPRAMMPPRREYLSEAEHRAMGDRVASLPVEGMLILVESETTEGLEYRVQRLAGGTGWSCECEKGTHTRGGEPSECVHARRAELKLHRAIMGPAWDPHMMDINTGEIPEWDKVDKAELPELVARAHEWVARTGGAS